MRSLNAWWDECKQEWMILHEKTKWRIHKIRNHGCLWSDSPQRWSSVQSSVMDAASVRCEWKLKLCFYKLTYIKMIASAHWNQWDITHMNRNTKSDINATQHMKACLPPKQLTWMCQWLLDAMWDVRAARLMCGVSSTVSGWRILVKLRLWPTCHKSRKNDTWWEVSEMILAFNLQLLKIVPWIKGFLCMFPWEK